MYQQVRREVDLWQFYSMFSIQLNSYTPPLPEPLLGPVTVLLSQVAGQSVSCCAYLSHSLVLSQCSSPRWRASRANPAKEHYNKITVEEG